MFNRRNSKPWLAAILAASFLAGCASVPDNPSSRVPWPGPDASQDQRDRFYDYYKVKQDADGGVSVAGRKRDLSSLPEYYSAMGYQQAADEAGWNHWYLGVGVATLASFTAMGFYLQPLWPPWVSNFAFGSGAFLSATWFWAARPSDAQYLIHSYNRWLRNISGADAE